MSYARSVKFRGRRQAANQQNYACAVSRISGMRTFSPRTCRQYTAGQRLHRSRCVKNLPKSRCSLDANQPYRRLRVSSSLRKLRKSSDDFCAECNCVLLADTNFAIKLRSCLLNGWWKKQREKLQNKLEVHSVEDIPSTAEQKVKR